MTAPHDPESSSTRDELLQRLEVMECMIAEGRAATMRNGWIFVLWGLVDLVGFAWQTARPHMGSVWPICLAAGMVLQIIGLLLVRRRSRIINNRCRHVEAVWSMMGVAMVLYVVAILITHLGWQLSYISAILMILGLANAISAVILRWPIQGVVAAFWWIGGISVLFFQSFRAFQIIFVSEMCFGMIAFGLYVMFVERRNPVPPAHHA